MSWRTRTINMVVILAAYLIIIRPNVQPGILLNVSDWMVSLGAVGFGVASVIRLFIWHTEAH